MKKLIFLILVIIAAGAGAYWFSYSLTTQKKQSYTRVKEGKTLVWLQKEYELSPEQFARIKELHDAYQPVCMDLCKNINLSNEKVENLIGRSTTLTPELTLALEENARIRTECNRQMLQHIYSVAAVMNPEQSRRYLALMASYMMSPSRSIDEFPKNQETSDPHHHDR